MTHVLESAWQDVERLIHGRKLDYTALRTVMSVRIMAGCEMETAIPTT